MTLYATPIGRGPLALTEGYRDADGKMHGSRCAYNNGCRCDDCRAAENEYSQRRRDEARSEPPRARDIGWMDLGACRGHAELPNDAWFPTGPNPTRDTVRAQLVCMNDCPVQFHCLRYGRTHLEVGIWGGQRLFGDRTTNRRRKPKT